MELNPMLKGLAFLVGKWECKKGAGFFPTITTFGYKDTVEFRQVGGQPLLAYSAWSSHPEKGAPMHLESGFLRATGDSGDGNTKLAFMVAHNFGLTSLEEGMLAGKRIELSSVNIGRMSSAKDPQVLQMKRIWSLEDESTMSMKFSMATSKTPDLTEHLDATYKKVTGP